MLRPTAAAVLALLLLVVPSALAGAVFEVRENVPTNPADLKFAFGTGAGQTSDFPTIGSIKRSGGTGAGAFFKSSAIPLAIFTLERCTAVAPHIHPNAAETLFLVTGKVRVYQFRGEEDQTAVRTYDLIPGQAGYIQQGAYHFVENIWPGRSQFLQIFDHPQGGANFASPALTALKNANPSALKVVNSAFSSDIFSAATAANGALIKVRGCTW